MQTSRGKKLDQKIVIEGEDYILVPYPKDWQVDEALRVSKLEFYGWYVPERLLDKPKQEVEK